MVNGVNSSYDKDYYGGYGNYGDKTYKADEYKIEECQTCKNRKYKDGSNENDVSFKTPGHINPENSMAKVMSHEKEHVSNAFEKANKRNGEVVSATVTLKTARCPECGRSYVSGGVTNTMIRYKEGDAYSQNAKSYDKSIFVGKNVDDKI